MKRRDFLFGAAAMLLFPSDAFASTVVRHERTLGRKKPNTVADNALEKDFDESAIQPPKIVDTDMIMNMDDISPRQVTNRIIVHHTGTKTDCDMSANEAHIIHKYEFGWAGIGYHYIIRKDGSIEEGRPENLTGAHALYNNKDSIGIALSGNFNLGDPTNLQIESLISLIAYLSDKYGLNPKNRGVLQGHREICDTNCPGVNMFYRLDYVRNAV